MKSSEPKKGLASERTLWLDWLRIIGMLWIILFHFCDYTSVKMGAADLSASWLVLSVCKLGGVSEIAPSFLFPVTCCVKSALSRCDLFPFGWKSCFTAVYLLSSHRR